MPERLAVGRRWWQYKRTWLIGLPTVLVLGVIGLFVWGGFQPRPAGFAAIEPEGAALVEDVVAVVEDEVAAVEEEWTRYTLDARSMADWVLFDFEKGSVMDGDFASPGWDVAFRRTKLLTNSGVTNPSGPGGAFDLGEVPLETASAPASVSFAVDRLGGDDDDEPENPAMGGWYSYSFIKHIVSVKPNTYLVRTGGSSDALVQFDSYYCEDEEPGCITFRYRLIPSFGEAAS
ncbi:MAG: HmuY family protein [Acidimicrobiia bacterium]